MNNLAYWLFENTQYEKHSHCLSFFQRKVWLREALSDVCKGQMDEVNQMKQCLDVLCKEGMKEKGEEERDEEDEDERESAFEMLSDLTENLDNARGNEAQNPKIILTSQTSSGQDNANDLSK